MAKVDRIIALLQDRIAQGDYALRAIPAEMQLANETGVSRMTARKAVLHLVEDGVLKRGPNGRLVVKTTRPFQVGLLLPECRSAQVDRWRAAVVHVVSCGKAHLRVVQFRHWNDPVLLEACNSFDGVFLVPPAERIPDAVATRLRDSRARLVALDADLTPFGVRSVDLIPSVSIDLLLDHLTQLGHRTIHCFNTQPLDSVVAQRIEQWERWRSKQNSAGQLMNHPDKSYGNPAQWAHDAMSNRLAEGSLSGTAVLCITMPAAAGAMRAMFEAGLTVGRDVSVCAANDEGLAAFLWPRLTSTRMPDPIPHLAGCLRWMRSRSSTAAQLIQPAEVPLFIGESTGPAPRK
jgi:hypothetical protein